MGDAPHEEYVPTSEELHLLRKEDPQVYETYWEVLCHFHICGQMSTWRNRAVKKMSWASYLINDINEKSSPVTSLDPALMKKLLRVSVPSQAPTPPSRIRTLSNLTRFLKVFITRPKFSSLTGLYWRVFLILWLKCCVVPMLPHEVIVTDVV